MFLSILCNRSGDEYIRRLAPNESLDIRAHVRAWLAREYDGYSARAIFSEWGAQIPNGCGEFQAEIRRTKHDTGVVWDSEPFFVEFEES